MILSSSDNKVFSQTSGGGTQEKANCLKNYIKEHSETKNPCHYSMTDKAIGWVAITVTMQPLILSLKIIK